MSDNEKRKAYEAHRLQWMISHGFTLTDLVNELQKMIDEDFDGNNVPTALKNLFEDWEYGHGFGGEIWPCYDEFIDCDYPNEQFDDKVICATLECKHNEDGLCTAKQIRLSDGHVHTVFQGFKQIWECKSFEMDKMCEKILKKLSEEMK